MTNLVRSRAGWLVAASMAVLVYHLQIIRAVYTPFANYLQENEWAHVAVVQTAAFLLPFFIALFISNKKGRRDFRLKGFPIKAVPFIVLSGMCVSVIVLFINTVVLMVFGQQSGQSNYRVELGIALIAIMPAVCEELFLRGAVLASLKKCGGWAIIISGLSFAMLHGSLNNFAGTMVAGMIYAWLAIALDSVLAAISAHFINNVFTMVMTSLINTFTLTISIELILALLIFFFLLLSYFALSFLAGLNIRSVSDWGDYRENTVFNAVTSVFSLPFLLFAVLFIQKIDSNSMINGIIHITKPILNLWR